MKKMRVYWTSPEPPQSSIGYKGGARGERLSSLGIELDGK